MKLIGVLFISICLIPAYLNRKRISYLFCPDSIIGFNVKSRIFVLFNFFPSIFVAGIFVTKLRGFMTNYEKLQPNENYALVPGFAIFIIFLFIGGILTDKVLYLTNAKFKEWKDKCLPTDDLWE